MSIEYQFEWGGGSVTVDYAQTNGGTTTYYSQTFASLSALFGTPDANGNSSSIVLVKQ